MAECLQKACPCLGALWERIHGRKRPPGEAGVSPPSEVETRNSSGGAVDLETPVTPGVPQPGIYTALWYFEARHPDELSFQEGDLFSVLNRNGEWWTARKIDRNGCVLGTGIVPNNYLVRAESLKLQPWFYGTMNRFEAQSHLMGPGNEEGAFLIRRSEKDSIGYVLSVRASNRVRHYKISEPTESNFHVEQSHQFSSLVKLVEHYSTNSLNNTGSLGLPCKRKKPDISDLSHFTVDEWELPKEEFEVGELLGSGYFADVYRGCWKNQINVAIKILKSDSEMNRQEFQREVQMLKSLRHRHLISLFAICTASAPYFIITELMEKGNLLSFLRGPEGAQQDVASLTDMAAQVADGMSYLEEKNSIHRDLAARNVLVGEDYICKVADFGLARVIKEPVYVTDAKKMPYKWSAPEAISHGRFSTKSDVWSFGILLYEIITYGGVPYPALSIQETYQQVMNGYRMPKPSKCPNFFYEIMVKCWQAEPDARPDFKKLKIQLDNSYVFGGGRESDAEHGQ